MRVVELEARIIRDQIVPVEGKLNGAFSTVNGVRRLSEVEIKRALAEGVESHRVWVEANFREMRVPLSLGKHKSAVARRNGRAGLRFMHGEILRQMLKETI